VRLGGEEAAGEIATLAAIDHESARGRHRWVVDGPSRGCISFADPASAASVVSLHRQGKRAALVVLAARWLASAGY
jgi:hypothetical protein